MIKYNKFEMENGRLLNDGECCCSSREFPFIKMLKNVDFKKIYEDLAVLHQEDWHTELSIDEEAKYINFTQTNHIIN
jgi:hypothetical protein